MLCCRSRRQCIQGVAKNHQPNTPPSYRKKFRSQVNAAGDFRLHSFMLPAWRDRTLHRDDE